MTARILQFPAQPRIAAEARAEALRVELGFPPMTPELRELLVKARAAIGKLPKHERDEI